MELIGYYLLFAFSISLTACYLWFLPLVRLAKAEQVSNTFTNNTILSTFVYITVSAIVAPLLVPPMFSSDLEQRFLVGLKREIFKQDSETQA
jgi:hypothetical protein